MNAPLSPTGAQAADHPVRAAARKSLVKQLWRDRFLYTLLLPVVVYFLLFKYTPLFGEMIAFKNFRLADGIWGSEWAGLKHFRTMFQTSDFYHILGNTLLLNVYSLVFAFPAPILLALLLNEVRKEWFKRIVQNLLYLPHFISWVILGMIIIGLLSPSTGFINYVLKLAGLEPIYFMGSTAWWPVVYIGSSIWREAGFGTILYLAAMTGIDPHLYEAAKMDGAGRLRQIWHVTLPGIRSTIALLLVLRMGGMMDVGFEQVYVLQNNMVANVANVMSTYIYRVGILNLQYSYTTAINLFQSLVGLVLVLSVNKIIRAMGEKGLW